MPLEWFTAQMDYLLFGGVLTVLLLATQCWWWPAGSRRFGRWVLPPTLCAAFVLGWALAEWHIRLITSEKQPKT